MSNENNGGESGQAGGQREAEDSMCGAQMKQTRHAVKCKRYILNKSRRPGFDVCDKLPGCSKMLVIRRLSLLPL